ncbi:MAG: hypothetical protein RIG82_06080 [Phycisphaeraceae bacterium]
MPTPAEVLDHHLGGFDTRDPDAVIEACEQARDRLLANPSRHGSLVQLPDRGRLIVTGDLHDNTLNLARVLHFADLDQHEDRHLVLHEVIHGPNLVNGRDLSIRMLAQCARLVTRYPDRVHVLQSNHELAQMLGDAVTKSGTDMNQAFIDGAHMVYPSAGDAVLEAANGYIRAMLLAVRAPNGLLAAHSLPWPKRLGEFDPGVLHRAVTDDDLRSGGSAHQLVWGRRHDDTLADHLGAAWEVTSFLLGHQKAEMGWFREGKKILVIASDHNHGVCLPVDLSEPADVGQYADQLHPLNSVLLG